MNPFELFTAEGKPTGIFACGVCRRLQVVNGDRERAEKCCQPVHCAHCNADLGPLGSDNGKQYWSSGKNAHVCWDCCKMEGAAKEARRLAAAELVTEWPGGWVYDDDNYHHSIDDYIDHLWCLVECGDMNVEDWPTRVFIADEVSPGRLDAHDLLSGYFKEMFEEAEEHFEGFDDLQAALDAFVSRNQNVKSYHCSEKQATLVPPYDDVVEENERRKAGKPGLKA